MSHSLPFTKMQGTGNDYIYINAFKNEIADPGPLAIRMSDRHFGVGGDGLVLIMPSDIADVRMRMFNADGSEAEMCGNATRCVGKYVYDYGLVKKETINLETAAGIKIIRLKMENGKVTGATVDMGEPVFDAEAIPVTAPDSMRPVINLPVILDNRGYKITAVSMGNPHAVLFVENVESLDLPAIGPGFEFNPLFPRRTNTEFVQVLDRSHIRMRVWERGSGETLACGTGACAALVACALNNLADREAEVEVRGGQLFVKWDTSSNHVFLSGPAVTVFEGEYYF